MRDWDAIYDILDYSNGKLLSTTEEPTSHLHPSDWLENGEWLSAAKKAGAEKVFFVGNNPVAVFAQCANDASEKIKRFNRIWSLARPRILFLATPGELNVLDLAQEPIWHDKGETDKKQKQLKSLAILHDINRVAKDLQEYHRDNIESGSVFEGGRFGDIRNRADNALISDLKTVRRELIHAGLSSDKLRFAHALIGRSIFIRYLEDRKILSDDYFRKVARQKKGWSTLLNNPTSRYCFNFSECHAIYPRVLEDKKFTYALFRALARDFNGDMFPDVDEEEKIVEQDHLKHIQDLFYGDVGVQKKLFFYSYHFDIVPLDLISSIYEEFYHQSTSDDEKKAKARQDGAYYTPPVLVEFVLSRVLTPEVIREKPRVLDPACGSGVFLVEAFRRMARYEWMHKKAPLIFDELKSIIEKQIAGIEVNEEAARIAAFSLYLAMLHYMDPPSILKQIRQGNKLPYLLVSGNRGANHFNSIWVGNAFDTVSIESDTVLKKQFGEACADVIVGNPPWGSIGSKADNAAKEREKVMLAWCNDRNFPIGDKEPSQAFLWRATDFLKLNGKCALLTSAGVLFKHSATTQAFRNKWMSQVCITEVFNFTHVRKFFFQGADSPFVLIHFQKSDQNDTSVEYWSPKQVAALKETHAILLSKYDRAYLVRQDLTDNKTWKVSWFGRHADVNFIYSLQSQDKLESHLNKKSFGRGFEACGSIYLKTQLGTNSAIKSFNRYSSHLNFYSPPQNLYRLGNTSTYSGRRLILQRGISEKGTIKGFISTRYENESFCFTNAIIGIKLKNDDEFHYLLFLGLLWSSLSRYFFFKISANWGLWHHEVHNDELLQFPIPKNLSGPHADKIISIVQKLRNYHPQVRDLMNPDGVPQEEIDTKRREWETELDEAVFDLYDFTDEQRDLIRDCCEVTLPFFYQPYTSVGVKPAVKGNDTSWIEKYAHIFARRWKPYLKVDEEIRAEVHLGAHGNMLAIEFFPADATDEWNLKPEKDSWDYILEEIGQALPYPMGTSQILLDGVVHSISNNSIVIIKRNEKRFWTRSLAREDADATLYKAMRIEIDNVKGDE